MRLTAWLAWGQFVVAMVAAVIGLALFYHSGHTSTDPADLGLSPLHLAYALIAGVGALIASRQPSNPVGWLLCFGGLTSSLGNSGLGYGYVYESLDGPLGPLPGAVWVAWLSVIAQSLGGPFVASLGFILFPTGRPASPRWRVVMWMTIGLTVLNALLVATQPQALPGYSAIDNPLGISRNNPLAETLATLAGWSDMLAPIVLVIGAASVLNRFRNARGVERQQLKWVVYALALIPVYFAILITGTFLSRPGGTETTQDGVGVLVSWGWACLPIVVATMPISIAIAILRYRLYDIDLIIRRTLTYGVMTAVLAAVYWICVAVLQETLRPVTQGSDFAIVASTLAVAALFQPVRRRIQQVVDLRFYRRKYDATRTLEAFSSRLREDIDLDKLQRELIAVVNQTIQPAHTSLWLRRGDAVK